MASAAAAWAGGKASASATVERWFQDFLRLRAAERSGAPCPPVLGIDEHFFTRRQGYATTFCDLREPQGLRRRAGAQRGRAGALSGSVWKARAEVRVVCMDLASSYRALVRKHFPNARIVADRFHVIRLINHHFLACWRDLDPAGSKNRGLLSPDAPPPPQPQPRAAGALVGLPGQPIPPWS